MNERIKLFDIVALTVELPDQNLRRGQVGTVVEVYTPDDFEVEFSDISGHTYALTSISASQLLLLHHAPIENP